MKNYIPFNYIIYLALETMLEYENKLEISIDDLKEYRRYILKKLSELYQNEDKKLFHHPTTKILKGQLLFEEIDEDYELAMFVKENSHICYLENNTLKIYESITKDDIEVELENCEYDAIMIRGATISIKDNPHSLEILKVTKIKNILENFLELEQSLLDNYLKLSLNQNQEPIIKEINFQSYIIQIFLNKLASLETDELRKYARLLNKLKIEREGRYDYYDKLRQDIYKTTIFSDTSISSSKPNNYILNILNIKEAKEETELECSPIEEYNLDEFDAQLDEFDNQEDEIILNENYDDEEDDEESFEDENYLYEELKLLEEEYQTNLYFHLKYLEKIDKYLATTKDEILEKTKYRILYLLDNYNYKLYDQTNFLNLLSDCEKEITINKNQMKEFLIPPKFLIKQIFEEEQDELTLRKLLYLSTYYELTKDEKIKENIIKYKSNINYQTYYEIIFSDENNLSNEKGKTLRKK